MSLLNVPAGKDLPEDIYVVIEIPAGDSHGRGIDHVFWGSARDGKPERTGNGDNEG